MKDIMEFLRELSENNNKQWFDANKSRYMEIKEQVGTLTVQLLEGIKSFDPTVDGLAVKDCTYRIYRDVRFSKDKSPYKTHIGIFITRGGKKSGYNGYYFQISADPASSMVAAGNIECEPDVLKVLREDISMGNGEFRKLLAGVDSRFEIDKSNSLKRVPAPFPADGPDSDFYKLKYFCLVHQPDEKFMISPDLVSNLLDMFRSSKPFLDFTNRAIDYCREEKYFASVGY